jgi:hypothetical protein
MTKILVCRLVIQRQVVQNGTSSPTRGDGGKTSLKTTGYRTRPDWTQELLAARRVDGADQFFSRAYDFGFSKTTAEALKI